MCPSCGHAAHAGRCFKLVPMTEATRPGYVKQCPCKERANGLANDPDREPGAGRDALVVAEPRSAGSRGPTIGELAKAFHEAVAERDQALRQLGLGRG
jgi:hypothetical protein